MAPRGAKHVRREAVSEQGVAPVGKCCRLVRLHTSRQQHHPWERLRREDSQTPTPNLLIQKLWRWGPKQPGV